MMVCKNMVTLALRHHNSSNLHAERASVINISSNSIMRTA